MTFEDIRDLLDQALASPSGIRVYQPSYGKLVSLRQRLHKARVADRKINASMYPAEDPRARSSIYDALSVNTSEVIAKAKRVNGTWPDFREEDLFLEIVKRETERMKVEEI